MIMRVLLALRLMVSGASSALEAGVTSVRELGGLGLNLRRGTEDGSLPLSPHIYASGFVLSITGGHGDFHDLDLDVCGTCLPLLLAPRLTTGLIR